jgi:hypothetical protein
MGSQGIKTEHAGHKGSGRKSGFWGLRAEAKYNSKRKRRTDDKKSTSRKVIESEFCKGCLDFPCVECDNDTIIFDCDNRVTKKK